MLILDEDHKTHLKVLTEIDTEVAEEFCRIAAEFMRKNINPKIYQSAATKLGINQEDVSNAIEGIIHLYLECAKINISDVEMNDTLLALGFKENLKQIVVVVYKENNEQFIELVSGEAVGLPHCVGLKWRADVEVASRSLRHIINPAVILGLSLKSGGKLTETILQTDPSTLVHITQQLENALLDSKSQHARRIMRHIK